MYHHYELLLHKIQELNKRRVYSFADIENRKKIVSKLKNKKLKLIKKFMNLLEILKFF